MTTKDEALRLAREALELGDDLMPAQRRIAFDAIDASLRRAALDEVAAIDAALAEQGEMPELPLNPHHGWAWTEQEKRSIVVYGLACAESAMKADAACIEAMNNELSFWKAHADLLSNKIESDDLLMRQALRVIDALCCDSLVNGEADLTVEEFTTVNALRERLGDKHE